MNCPHHILIYESTQRSYRELPVKLAELGTMYRYEAVRGPQWIEPRPLHDAQRCPFFCTHDQIEDEFSNVMRLVEQSYNDLGLKDVLIPALVARSVQ